MTLRRAIIASMLLAFLLPACASGPKFATVMTTQSTVPPDKGRVYFYRPSALGAAVQPDVFLNGTKVGTAKPHGVYFVDRAPGDCLVTSSTETEKQLTFTLAPAQVRYVRLKIQMGFFVGRIVPELVDRVEAEEEMRDLSFVANPLE